MKLFFSIAVFFIAFNFSLKAQNFNDFYIKQQLAFYEKDSASFKTLETLKNFILSPDKSKYVENYKNEYCSEFLDLIFNKNIPEEYYHYVPMVYYKKDNFIVFEVDIIESVGIENTLENKVYANLYIPVNLETNKITLEQSNVKILPDIQTYLIDGINIIANSAEKKYDKEVKKMKQYLKNTAKILFIPKSLIKENKLTVISSSSLNDGYFYYGINRYAEYVNNYKNDKIFSGNNSIFYTHEIIHYLIGLKTKEKINPVISEGLATWIGGSLNYSYTELVKYKTESLDEAQINKIIDDFLQNNNIKDYQFYDYYLRALFVSSLFNNAYNDIEEKKLNILISSENESRTIKEIIDLMKLDSSILKQRMLHEIKLCKNYPR